MIIERIKSALPDMPAVNKKIAMYVLENRQSVGFASVDEMSKLIGVSGASIVRFAQDLEFSGYVEFRRAIQDEIKKKLSFGEKISISELDVLPAKKQIEKLFHNEKQNLEKTLSEISVESLTRMIEGIRTSERIFVSGFGVTKNLVQILEYGLVSIQSKNVIKITGSISDYSPRLQSFSSKDCLFILTFPPYSREGLQVANFAKKTGGRVFLFTDSPRCPIYPLADAVIRCEHNSLLLTNSYVGVIAVEQIFLNMILLDDKSTAVSRMQTTINVEQEGYRDLGSQEEPA